MASRSKEFYLDFKFLSNSLRKLYVLAITESEMTVVRVF